MNRIKQYLIDSIQELGKVTWPTKNRAVNICILVVTFVLVSTIFIAGVDFLFNLGYSQLLMYSQSLPK